MKQSVMTKKLRAIPKISLLPVLGLKIFPSISIPTLVLFNQSLDFLVESCFVYILEEQQRKKGSEKREPNHKQGFKHFHKHPKF